MTHDSRLNSRINDSLTMNLNQSFQLRKKIEQKISLKPIAGFSLTIGIQHILKLSFLCQPTQGFQSLKFVVTLSNIMLDLFKTDMDRPDMVNRPLGPG